jgi:hypothetical protein
VTFYLNIFFFHFFYIIIPNLEIPTRLKRERRLSYSFKLINLAMNTTEKAEVGEILARLNAGSISVEEAKSELQKFSNSPTQHAETDYQHERSQQDEFYPANNEDQMINQGNLISW